MSDAVVASDGTATLDWVLVVATSDGDWAGAVGVTTDCWAAAFEV